MYSVKIVNPARKSEYTVKKLGTHVRFPLDELTEEWKKCLKTISPSQIGYIEPGHGLKGKQRWLCTDEDVDTTYDIYMSKTEILLGCFSESPKGLETATSKSKKRILADGEPGAGSTSSKSKKEAIASKLTEVESIMKKLQDKHGSQYSVEKFNAWAHLIHVGKQLTR